MMGYARNRGYVLRKIRLIGEDEVERMKKYTCPACGEDFEKFDNINGEDKICPECGYQDNNLDNFALEEVEE